VRAEEIADAVTFLAPLHASGITGERIAVAGGAERSVRYLSYAGTDWAT
jgi:enoyl-[acyl-carrier-protein] reductase (NADH)